MTNDNEHKHTPEWLAWEAENRRRSEAMTSAVHPIQGKHFDPDEDDPAEPEQPDG